MTVVSGDVLQVGLLRHRDFRLLWGGGGVSDLGTAISGVVLPLVAVVYLRAGAFAVGALAAAEWAPWLVIALPAGVWVDRSRCRTLMIACDLVRLCAIGSVPLTAAAGELDLGQLFAVAVVTGVATVIFQVAYQAYLPALVGTGQLAEANAKLQGTHAVAGVAGPGLGGLFVQVFRAPYALVADALSYGFSACALLRVRTREAPREPAPRNLRHEIAEGMQYVRADPLLRVMTIAPALANLFFTGFSAIEVLFLVRSVHLAPASVGLLVGIVSLGSVIGAAVARPIGRRVGTARAAWLATTVTAPFGLLIAATTRGAGLVLFVAGALPLYVGILVYNVTIGAFRQTYCAPRVLGRVVATMRVVLFGAVPVGALSGGLLAGLLGPRTAVLVLLIGNVTPGLVLTASPLRRMRDLPTEQTVGRAVSAAPG